MPRYKVVCGCKREFWCKKDHKLNTEEKQQLRHGLCSECAAIYRARYQQVKSGQFELLESDRAEFEKTVNMVRENKPFGFARTPAREYFEQIMEKDKKTIAEGITTRYRGFSPTREMLKYRYRVLAGEQILALAAA